MENDILLTAIADLYGLSTNDLIYTHNGTNCRANLSIFAMDISMIRPGMFCCFCYISYYLRFLLCTIH